MVEKVQQPAKSRKQNPKTLTPAITAKKAMKKSAKKGSAK